MKTYFKFVIIGCVRLFVALYKIIGYTLACIAQALWYGAHGRIDKVGDAIGFLGRGITDAFTDIFKV